jgi:hypothetical protein
MRRFAGLWALCFLCFLPLSSLQASAARVGEIAVIEDSDGVIHLDTLTQFFQVRAACAFYRHYEDVYDALFFFTTRQLNLISNVAQGFPVNSPSKGIGRAEPGQAALFCSAGRLRQAVRMGSIVYMNDDPYATYSGIPGFTLTGVELMGHEFGHQWLANVDFRGEEDLDRQCLLRAFLGNGDSSSDTCNGQRATDFNQHWSTRFNQPSVMYANSIEDLGNGQFRVFRAPLKFGEFDQYLMGLRLAREVSPSFVVSAQYLNETEGFPIAQDQERTISGQRIDVNIEDVQRMMGPREPELEPCHWKAAFIIVHDPGYPPSPEQIIRVDRHRVEWEAWYEWATDGRGSFDTTLDGCGLGTEQCPGEPSATCGQDDCTEALRRCNGPAIVQTCHGGEWVFEQECGVGFICELGECVEDEDLPEDGDSPEDGDQPEDGDIQPDGDDIEDGDQLVDGDTPGDADDVTDGDIPTQPCSSHADCQVGLRCTSQGCAPCPEGQEFDGSRCVLLTEGDGGGCAHAPTRMPACLVVLGIALGVLLLCRIWPARA